MLTFICIEKKTKVQIQTIHDQVIQKLRRCGIKEFEEVVNQAISEPITVKYNSRLKTTAGRADKNGIELNLPLLAEHPDQLPQVYVHELAHTLCRRIWPQKAKGHNKYWQYLMIRMGFHPTVRHSMDVAKFVEQYVYQCECESGVRVGKQTHQKIKTEKRTYCCKRCRVRLLNENFIGRAT